jgi:hypothetical protein
MSRLYQCFIGNARNGNARLARDIRAKCERARAKQESIGVLMDDDGDVYAGLLGGSAIAYMLVKNPHWIVATYSMASPEHWDCAPSLIEIADDLNERQKELVCRRAA